MASLGAIKPVVSPSAIRNINRPLLTATPGSGSVTPKRYVRLAGVAVPIQ